MSHIATITLIVKDLDALALACESLGCELIQQQRHYKWYGRAVGRPADLSDGKCEHAIRVKGNPTAYEIGLVAKAEGGYELKWDSYNNGYGLVEKVGPDAGKLKQAYATEVSVRISKRQGHRIIKRTVRSDGAIVLITQKG